MAQYRGRSRSLSGFATAARYGRQAAPYAKAAYKALRAYSNSGRGGPKSKRARPKQASARYRGNIPRPRTSSRVKQWAGGNSARTRGRGARGYRKIGQYSRALNSPLLKMLAPARIVKGEAFHTLQFDNENRKHFFNLHDAAGERLVHGSGQRFNTVMKAALHTATTTDFDGNRKIIWAYSGTKWTLHNPCNFDLVIVIYEVGNKHQAQDADVTPVVQLNVSLGDNDRFPSAVANRNSDIPFSTVTNITGTPYWQMDTVSWLKTKHFGHAFWDKFKVLKRQTIIIAPGGYHSFTQKSRYGLINGGKFSQGVYLADMTRTVLFSVTTGPLNTSGDNAELGLPKIELSIRIHTTDVVREPLDAAVEYFHIDTTIGGANAAGYQPPAGSVFTVASEVGALNVAADVS